MRLVYSILARDQSATVACAALRPSAAYNDRRLSQAKDEVRRRGSVADPRQKTGQRHTSSKKKEKAHEQALVGLGDQRQFCVAVTSSNTD